MSRGSSPNHDEIVADWRENSERRFDENYEFLRGMKFRSYGFQPDQLAGKLHDQAFELVDCTRCANCCKTVGIPLSDGDIVRIAGHLRMSTEAFIATYLEKQEHGGGYQIRAKPCPFLGADDRCTIYEIRPELCQQYPHTNKPGFTSRTIGHAHSGGVALQQSD